jgi:hypothetical protein
MLPFHNFAASSDASPGLPALGGHTELAAFALPRNS